MYNNSREYDNYLEGRCFAKSEEIETEGRDCPICGGWMIKEIINSITNYYCNECNHYEEEVK